MVPALTRRRINVSNRYQIGTKVVFSDITVKKLLNIFGMDNRFLRRRQRIHCETLRNQTEQNAQNDKRNRHIPKDSVFLYNLHSRITCLRIIQETICKIKCIIFKFRSDTLPGPGKHRNGSQQRLGSVIPAEYPFQIHVIPHMEILYCSVCI